jgi:hypothetical protein
MYKLKCQLREWGYKASHPEYWILSHSSGWELWIRIGSKTKHLDRVRDWFVRPTEEGMKVRNADFLYDLINEIKTHVEILNKMED